MKLPAAHITPVHRSDDSGTTDNFTDYLHQTAGSVWTNVAGETWPYKSGEGAEGTSGVVQAVTNGAGTIGYADASQVGKLSVASIKVGSSYQAPTTAAAAKAASTAKTLPGRSSTDMALAIDRTSTASGSYPLTLISYFMACPSYSSSNAADLVKGYGTYAVSSAGQESAGKVAGSAPLPSNLSQQATALMAKIKKG